MTLNGGVLSSHYLIVALVIVIILSRCEGRDCDSSDRYCTLKAIWHEDIACTNKEPRCQQLQLAYYRDTGAIDISQDLNYQLGSKDNWTLLMMASHQGHYELVQKLLDSGAREGIDKQDKCGWSALMFAAFTGSSEVVGLLLDYGANINGANGDGRTALFMASGKGHVETVKLLLQRGANTRHEDVWGLPAIKIGVYYCYECQPDVVRAFLYNCDNDVVHLRGALWAAAYDYCCPEIVDDLISFGAPTHDIPRILSKSNPKCKNCESACERARAKLILIHTQTLPDVKSRCPIRKSPLPTGISKIPLLATAMVACLVLSVLFLKRYRKRQCRDLIRLLRQTPQPPNQPMTTTSPTCTTSLSEESTIIEEQCIEPDETLPLDLTVLMQFPGRSKKLEIHNEIPVSDYVAFGTQLLNDNTGTKIATLEARFCNDIPRINTAILTSWLNGKGKPIAWGVLVQILRDVRLNRLANDIEDGLNRNRT